MAQVSNLWKSLTVRIVVWVTGSVLALLILLLLAVHTPPVRRYALKQAVQILGDQGVTFDANRIDYNLFKLTATLNNVTVRSKTAPDLPALAHADSVYVDLSLRKMISGAIYVQDGTVRNLAVHLVIDKDGRDNIPRSPKKDDQKTTKTDWFIDKFLIDGGTVRVEDRRQQLEASLPLNQLSIDGNPATSNHDIKLSARPGRVSFEGRELPVREVNADLQLQENALQVRNLKLGVGESNIALSGKMDNLDDPRYDFKADTDLELGSLVEFAGVKQRVDGTVHASLTATGPLNQLKASATLDGDNLTIDRFDKLSVKAETAYDSVAQRVRLQSFNVASPMGTIQGKADLALAEKAGESTLNAAVRGLDLARISNTLALPMRIASSATADVAARWPAMKYEQAAGNATVRLAATRSTAARNLIPLSGTINAKTAGNRIVIGIPSLRALDASASGQVTLIHRKALSGNVKVAAADLDRVIKGAEALLGEKPGSLTGIDVQGPATLNARLSGTVENPAALTAVESPGLRVGTLEGVTIAATADYNPSRLEIRSSRVEWQGQSITAAGIVGLKGAAPAFNVRAESSELSIPTLLAAAGKSDVPASGTLRLQAVATGTTKNPQATVNVTGSGLTAYNETLGTLTATAQLAGKLVTVDQLRLQKPQEGGDGSLEARGSYDLQAKTYTIDSKSDNLRLTSLTLPDGTPVRAKLDFNADGSGTLQNPALNLKLEADDIEYAGTSYGSANVTAKAENQLADIVAEAPKFNLTAKANIRTLEPYPATFEVNARDTDLATLPVKMTQPLEGTVTASVRGSADLKNPEAGEARVEVAQADLKWNGQPVRTDGPLIATYRNRILDVERATITALNSRVSINGRLPLDANAPAGSINIASTLDLPSLVAYVPNQQLEARGTATINGTITGTLKSIDPRLNISLTNGYFATPTMNPPLSNVTLQAQVADGALELQKASAEFGPAVLSATGQIPFALLPAMPVELPRRQGPAQFTADLQNLDLATIQGLPENLSGVVAARVEARAERPEIEALEAKLTFPKLAVAVDSYGLEQKGVSTIMVRNGVAAIEQFQLTGPETNIQLSGTAGLTGSRPLDLRLEANADAAIASVFTDTLRARGPMEIRASVTGTAAQPNAAGYLQLADAQLSMQDPRIGIDGLNARIDLVGTRANLTQLTGSLNGGTLSGGGGLSYVNGELRDTDLTIKAERVYMDAPVGLKTVSNVDLRFRSTPDNLILGGNVVIEDGGFTDNLNLDTGLMAALSQPRGVELTERRNPMVESIRFDIAIRTANPLIIDNNLAEAEVEADLRLLGNPYQPGLSGRLSIAEGGVLRLNEREYIVDRGEITFANERRIEPAFDILANTRAGDFDITLQIGGVPGKTETTLTSDPPLPEPDIMAVLLTGKKLDDLRGQEYEVARNQVLSYLTGRVGGTIGSQIAGATGLSTVRIEPNLIANETDPSARLTVGQDITRNLELIYSMDLINSSDQLYVAEYDLSRRFTTRGVRQSDGSFRFDFRHDVRFGGIPEPRRGDRRQQYLIDNVSITGNSYFTEKQLADKLGAKSGKRYDFFKSRKGVDKVEKMYRKENLLEAQVRLNRQVESGEVDLTLQVKPGPVVELVWEGMNPGGDLEKRVREIWHSGVFDRQRAEDAVQEIRTELVKDDHLQPEIKYAITTPAPDRKRVLFDIAPGPKFSDVEIVFEGANGIEPKVLSETIKKLRTEVYVKPGRVTELLSRYYAEQGYLEASVENPKYELDNASATGRVVFPVKEGPLFRIAKVEFNGNAVHDDAKLRAAVPLPQGEAYRPVLRERSLQAVQNLYWAEGYNDVDTEISTRRDKQAATVDVVVNIVENRKSIVEEIVIEGNQKTSNNLVSSQLALKAGEPLNLEKLSESRRNLYNTGAYSVVDIVREEAGAGEGERSRTTDGAAAVKPVKLTVKLREVQPFQIRYGGSFDTERGPGVIADFENRNSLGSARTMGLRTRYDSQLREARLYFSQPLLQRFPVKTIVSPFYRQERNPSTDLSDAFDVDRMGLSLQQEARFREFYILNYGYRIENSKTVIRSEFPIPTASLRVAALTSSLTRETRDDVLDATRGDLISQAFEFSPELLGSQVRFVKYFGQFFKYIPLEKPRVEIFTNRVARPRFVYAGAVRIGLAKGFGGQEVPLAERFFAGGSNTLRGFEQNSVGPVLFDRTPMGGEAMVVINNEVRHPLFKIVDVAGFVDIGNVYPRVSDISFGDLRKSAGMGLRLRTPWVLVRLDYGFKLDRKPGESAGRLFFSIGQAF